MKNPIPRVTFVEIEMLGSLEYKLSFDNILKIFSRYFYFHSFKL